MLCVAVLHSVSPRESIARAQAFGFFWGGPSNHYWQKFLEKFFKGKRDSATVVQKVRGQGFRMPCKWLARRSSCAGCMTLMLLADLRAGCIA